ncbi:outer membrane protein assembly factor BamB family protein [Arcticibacterium luteifluviistationis]|uniref:Pyrrolo-quinoline quinone n=1 Tax=Arcticibacterium luteifluviistationis TaxID=1784714 RepID=A0A2Z4GDA5_9BACT|nr:PQQ-binding-like beta-propeller repeat protein [Arcticibacterium luteifluviistationis]AWV99302.1 pyrrolo-quinoline quinone [Arcticibacterium luteifluviistationis]
MKKILIIIYCQSFLFLLASCGSSGESENVDWRYYGGDSGGTRYSELAQINTENVKSLKVAWEFDTGEEVDADKPLANQNQPIVVNGILYGTTSRQKLFALNAATGQDLWKFDPYSIPELKRSFHAIRGVVYWEEKGDKRILYTVGTFLLAINAATGELIESFGENGLVDLHQGLGDESVRGFDVNDYSIRSTSPGVIYNNTFIIGSTVSEGGSALPGNIRAFDAKSGMLKWVFNTIPLPGEYGYETWAEDSYKKIGGANSWAGMVVDQKRGMVFLGTGSPSVDFYGAERPGQNLFANCVIALDAKTGKRVWHFQTVHHDLWDKDIPCPPTLITVTQEGKEIEAVAQATKDGFIFIFDRDTGKPLFDVEEIDVPVSPALPGEKPWPTQPIPTKPKPFVNQVLKEEDITDRTAESHAFVLERFKNSNSGNKYLPPSEKGSLIYHIGGGAEWGGAAADPKGIMYVNGNNMLWWIQMRKVSEGSGTHKRSRGESLFNQNCSACHGMDKSGPVNQAFPSLDNIGARLKEPEILNILESGRSRMPSFQHLKLKDRQAVVDFLLAKESSSFDVHKVENIKTEEGKVFPYNPPYLNNGNNQFLDLDGYPAIKPLWGNLNAIDMNSGEFLWQVPFGEFPELMKKGLPVTGTENHGGPVVTAGGLLFIGASYDEKLRAIETKTGKTVWEYQLPAGGYSTPATYMVNGKQYVVITAGGARYGLKGGSKLMAFSIE